MEKAKYQYEITNLRWKPDYYRKLEKAARETGFSSVSSFLKFIIGQYVRNIK